MNEFYIRLLCLFAGMVLGYALAMIRHTMKDTHEIRVAMEDCHKMLTDQKRERDEAGFFRFSPYLVGWAAVVLLVAVSVLSTTRTNGVLAEAQRADARAQACTEQFLSMTVEALNERTKFTSAQSQANIELQESQLKFLTVIAATPPPSSQESETALNDYLNSLRNYSSLVAATRSKVDDFPYPTPGDYRDCLQRSNND